MRMSLAHLDGAAEQFDELAAIASQARPLRIGAAIEFLEDALAIILRYA